MNTANTAKTADRNQAALAARFRALHQGGALILPNVWDSASAAIVEAMGAPAIATTSGGISWAFGRADAQSLRREDMVDATARIVRAVKVPVSADIEGGYGLGPSKVGETVRAIIGVGAVGINLEDTPGPPGQPIHSASDQARRIEAARSAASVAGIDLFINARTDVFLFNIGRVDHRVADVLDRANIYRAAGADCLFVPGVVDLAIIEALAGGALPLNVIAGPGAPSVAELVTAGAIRVSVGTAIAQSAYQLVAEAASELLSRGTYLRLNPAMEYGELNRLLSG